MIIANTLQLGGRPTSRQSFWALLAIFVLRMRTHCYFRAPDQNSYITIRFIDPNFLKWSNNLAIKCGFPAVTLTFDIWSWTFLDDLAHFRCRYVTLWPWTSTTWPRMIVVNRVSRDQTLYQIWPKSNNLRLSYRSLSKFCRHFLLPVKLGEK